VNKPSNRSNGLAPALAALVIVLSAAMLAAGTIHTSREEVAEALTCQCGCGLTVANCNHPNCIFAVPVREKIDAMIAKGMSREQIIAFFRARYGEKILSSPTTTGFNLLAWTVPPAVLILAFAGIVLVFMRWRRAAAAAPAASHVERVHDPELRRRFERELRERL
jgi:cytochrome c-type biogenesis protein CcmH